MPSATAEASGVACSATPDAFGAAPAGGPALLADSAAAPGGATAPRVRRSPLDPRLVREVRAARAHIIRTTLLGLVQAAAIITVALVLGRLGSDLLVERISPLRSPGLLGILALALAVRALAILVQERTAHRAATDAIADLRSRLVAHAARLGPRGAAGRGADLATLATTGLENLRPYLVGYVPQLLLSATVTPLCLVALGWMDLTSAVIAAVTLPLVPIFMILIGTLTVGRSERLLADTRTLWSQMLDLVEGLPTLRALGRERGPERTVHDLGEKHRASTMGTLRYAFLSAMALELLATLCVALVAVSIGMRLVYGHMDLAPAIAVLVLVPEVYLPLRQVGAQFHASTDGLAATSAAFEVLAEPVQEDGSVPCPDLSGATLRLEGVSVASRDGWAPHRAEVVIPPGQITAIAGPSGSGKTTAVQVLLGLLAPEAGRAVIEAESSEAVDVQDLVRSTYWSQIAHLPQRPVLPPGTLREVLASSALTPPTSEQLEYAARASGLDRVVAERGWEAELGRGGRGLSLGERQRLALARTLLSPAPLVILDEPTAHLDGATEDLVLELMRTLRSQGRTVVLLAHRSRLLEVADAVVHLRSASREDEAAASVPSPPHHAQEARA